jgi:hypothetical protein
MREKKSLATENWKGMMKDARPKTTRTARREDGSGT